MLINLRTVGGLHQYLEIGRDELVTRCLARGCYDRTANPVGVRGAGRYTLTLEKGKRWAYAKIDAADRRRLMWMTDGHPSGPLWLWLGDRGEPVMPATWQSIFRRANKRCAKLGIPLEVHPHTLRHILSPCTCWDSCCARPSRHSGSARTGPDPGHDHPKWIETYRLHETQRRKRP